VSLSVLRSSEIIAISPDGLDLLRLELWGNDRGEWYRLARVGNPGVYLPTQAPVDGLADLWLVPIEPQSGAAITTLSGDRLVTLSGDPLLTL
jgi:hypothetical protein